MPGYWYSTEVDGDHKEDGGAHRGKVQRRRRTGAGYGGGPAGSSGALRLAPGCLLGWERTQLRGQTTMAMELDDDGFQRAPGQEYDIVRSGRVQIGSKTQRGKSKKN
jgi:hypothetical protein